MRTGYNELVNVDSHLNLSRNSVAMLSACCMYMILSLISCTILAMLAKAYKKLAQWGSIVIKN